jgi:hypothetical protein
MTWGTPPLAGLELRDYPTETQLGRISNYYVTNAFVLNLVIRFSRVVS